MGRDDKYDDGFAPLLPSPPSAGIGHNRGPEWLPIGDELESRLQEAHKKAIDRAEELKGKKGSYTKVEDAKALKKATEYVRQIQAAMTALEAGQKAEKEPYRVAVGQINGILGTPYDELDVIKRDLERKMTSYNTKVLREERLKREAEAAKKRAAEAAARRIQEEKDRVARETAEKAQKAIEEAARKAAESKKPAAAKAAPKKVVKAIEAATEAQRAADQARDEADDIAAETTRAERAVLAPAADITRARSTNAVQSAQEFVDFRNLDMAEIDLEALRGFLDQAAVEKALRSYIGVNNTIIKRAIRAKQAVMPGVEFWINARTRVGG